MRTSKTLQRACQVLRRKVRFKDAGLHLDGNWISETDRDTQRIREATTLYTESWIVPILDAIESGDTRQLKELIGWDRGDEMEDA